MNRKLIFLVLGLALVGTSFLLTERIYDIQLYDTYFIISWNVTLRTVGLLCALYGARYVLFKRARMSR